ncbi:peptidase S37 [Duganella sp. Leaf126]|uniref:ShlB/FhaC/HecB family hemolysin secretion/activation protein n=1 Tax=Duganella sp. Leaf126 TaxID=1736266 RepID=UPI0006F480B9|nr:ShlB/FhaC/HecB family hemolysin secretion/activation protein [Duganella sp. Leaf126]KQQ33272.1 peptidase S37 [Duganella sp. Leaf126]
MNHRLVHLLAGSALLLGASYASALPQETLAAEPAAAVADTPRFTIARYQVSGDTLLGPALVQALVAPFTGPQRDFGTIQQAVEALEDAYRARGYTLVQVMLPEQELDQGAVRLNVLEMPVGRIVISGQRYVDDANVRRALPALVAGQTPNMAELGRSLKLANENPARKLEVKLANGATDATDGTDGTDATLDAAVTVVDENPWKATLNLDNTGSDASGKTHAGVVLQHANLWGRDHVASLQYTTSLEHGSQIGVYGAGYHVPLYALGDALDFFASYSNVDSGTVSAGIVDLAVSGRGLTAGARYNQNFGKRDNYEPKLVYGVDFKAYRNSLQYVGTELGTDVTVHPLSIAYLGAWSLPGGEANLGLTLARNLPGGEHGRQRDFSMARAGAKADYSTVRLSASLGQVLGGDWQGRALFNGQYTPDALVPGEQFGVGGAASVRGFLEREVASDSGANLNLELYTPSWCGTGRYQCRALAFYDTGWVRRNHVLPGEVASTAIGSAGLGVRMLLDRYINAQLDVAHVVNPGHTGRRDANRLHFRVALSY